MTSFVTNIGPRIAGPGHANHCIGQMCTFISNGLTEYGCIANVMPTGMRIERMAQTINGEFIPHPIPHHHTTKNVLKFSRNIRLISTIRL